MAQKARGNLVTIGADVEVFAVNKEGKHISMCGKIGGTKEKPMQIEGYPYGFSLQEDNVSCEWNIPPADNLVSFKSYTVAIRKYLEDMFKKQQLLISTQCAVSFDKDQLTHPNALVFGCEPDYNAWTVRENTKPTSTDPSLRTAGGHIHIGAENVDMLDGIKAMDLYLGVPSVLLDTSPSATKRRELYGKSGAMRPKPYGFEYRVLSNFWMFDDSLIEFIYNNSKKAMSMANFLNFDKKTETRIQECINTSNKEEAKAIVAEFKIPLIQKSILDVLEGSTYTYTRVFV